MDQDEQQIRYDERLRRMHTHQEYWDDSPCPAGCGSTSVRWRDDIYWAICDNCHHDRTEEFLKLVEENVR